MLIDIYRYKSDDNLMWNDQETYLCVYDKNNIQIADYDFDTGLRLMIKNGSIHIYINDEQLVSGRWEFFGNLGNKPVRSSGNKNGDVTIRQYPDLDPWRFDHRPGTYITVPEREKRIDICRTCPMFTKEGMCKVNGMLAIERTKMRIGFCPEGKWGDADDAQSAYEEEFVNGPIKQDFDPEEQEDFNAEFDDFLKGL